MTISDIAKKAAAKLPPDVLAHPMPYPDRLDYAEKIIQEAIDESLNEGQQWNNLLNLELKNCRSINDDWQEDDATVRKFLFAMLGNLGVRNFDSECRTVDAAEFLCDLVRAKLAGRAAAEGGADGNGEAKSGAGSASDPNSATDGRGA